MFRRILSWGAPLGRAQTWLAMLILRIMPETKTKRPAIKRFGWYEITFIKPGQMLMAALGVSGVFPLFVVLFKYAPVLNFSIMSIIASSLQFLASHVFGVQTDLKVQFEILVIMVLILWSADVGSIFGLGPIRLLKGLPGFAMREELFFRMGCEKWNLVQRIRACLAFGLVHFTMVVVPISAALALTFGGAMFMLAYLLEYRRTASKQQAVTYSATVHTAYNALLLMTIVLVFIFKSLF